MTHRSSGERFYPRDGKCQGDITWVTVLADSDVEAMQGGLTLHHNLILRSSSGQLVRDEFCLLPG